MNTFKMLLGEWRILLVLLVVFLCSFLIGQILFALNNSTALKLAEKIDRTREGILRIICHNIYKPFGILRVILKIFMINLFGGAFIWSTIGGIFIVMPFLHHMITGFLTGMVVKRYPERVNWLTVPNVIFEIGAFMCAAVGGIHIGLSIFSGGNVYLAIVEWWMIFTIVVIPLQFLAAIFEGFLINRVFVIEKNPWPYGISPE